MFTRKPIYAAKNKKLIFAGLKKLIAVLLNVLSNIILATPINKKYCPVLNRCL
ncbi:MAG TPA: hypothetical protein VIH07_05280 [Candidatus Humimicrobiaceae bacterium]